MCTVLILSSYFAQLVIGLDICDLLNFHLKLWYLCGLYGRVLYLGLRFSDVVLSLPFRPIVIFPTVATRNQMTAYRTVSNHTMARICLQTFDLLHY